MCDANLLINKNLNTLKVSEFFRQFYRLFANKINLPGKNGTSFVAQSKNRTQNLAKSSLSDVLHPYLSHVATERKRFASFYYV
jgi:hypothetical protein